MKTKVKDVVEDGLLSRSPKIKVWNYVLAFARDGELIENKYGHE